jgi:DNA-binding transcriptional ArsR family regulator
MASKPMRPELLALVADRFKALSDRARLCLLQALRAGPLTVSELVAASGMGQANVSRHLAILHAAGLVARERDGVYVRYSLADEDVRAAGRGAGRSPQGHSRRVAPGGA